MKFNAGTDISVSHFLSGIDTIIDPRILDSNEVKKELRD